MLDSFPWVVALEMLLCIICKDTVTEHPSTHFCRTALLAAFSVSSSLTDHNYCAWLFSWLCVFIVKWHKAEFPANKWVCRPHLLCQFNIVTSTPVRYCNEKAVDEVQPGDIHLHVGRNPSTKKQNDKLKKHKRCPSAKETDEESGQKLPLKASAIVVRRVWEHQNRLTGKRNHPDRQYHGYDFLPRNH